MTRCRRGCLLGLFMVGLLSAQSRAGGCLILDPAHPANANLVQQGFSPYKFQQVPQQPVFAQTLPTPTLSRLAALSGPFQSFQDARVAKDPNCGRWGGRDKVRHVAIFFAATLGLQLFIESTFNVSKTEAFLASAAIGTLVGLSREFYDWRISDKDCFSEQDLLANTAGILAAGFVIMISD